MPEDRQLRLHTLMNANSQGTLEDAQRSELETLVVQGQRLSVRKARAAALLTERGYPVTRAALSSANECMVMGSPRAPSPRTRAELLRILSDVSGHHRPGDAR
jgi:hypothetical protein